MTNEIQWKDGAVCYANGKRWVLNEGAAYSNKPIVSEDESEFVSFDYIIRRNDFQLNEIRTEDFIAASELDTEQKYNDVVEVFGLFGFGFGEGAENRFKDVSVYGNLTICHDGIYATELSKKWCKRQLTYQQIMTIGKLKRMSDKKKTSNAVSTVNRDIERNQHKAAKDYLTECMEVQSQRGEQYDSTGTGERSFDAAAKAYNALTGGNLKGSDVCLILTCVKAVRQYSNPERLHEDSLLDMVSYSSLWAEELNKELK